MIFKVFNLIFPHNCDVLNIGGFQFKKIANYSNAMKKINLEGLGGENVITATVESENQFQVDDALILLSLFTGREVYIAEFMDIRDSAPFRFGLILRNSLHSCYIFEENINRIYAFTSQKVWQRRYADCLSKAIEVFQNKVLAASFIGSWGIFEAIYGPINTDNNQRSLMLLNVLINLGLIDEISEKYVDKIYDLFLIRNLFAYYNDTPIKLSADEEFEIVHRPEVIDHYEMNKAMEFFVEMVEIMIAKVLKLQPFNIYNSDIFQKVERFFETDTIVFEEILRKRGRLKWKEPPKEDEIIDFKKIDDLKLDDLDI